MRILIVDDNKDKNRWLRSILDQKHIEYDEMSNMNVAFRRLVNNPKMYNGIILGMKFPEISGDTPDPEMGKKFLKRLKNRKINIPVLGNANAEFPAVSEYPFLKGNTYGRSNSGVLDDFLKKI